MGRWFWYILNDIIVTTIVPQSSTEFIPIIKINVF